MSHSPKIKYGYFKSSIYSACNKPRGRGACYFCVQGHICHFLGCQISPESHFLYNLQHGFPIFGVNFQELQISRVLSSVIPQNKFLVIKFMTRKPLGITSRNREKFRI